MSELGSALWAARVDAGRRQCDVAARAAVDQPMISLYERGLREPTWPTFVRLLAASGAAAEVRIAELPPDDSCPTLGELARYLCEATSDAMRRRLALDFVGRYGDVDPGRRGGLLLGCPGSTGAVHWDALLGGLAEHLAFHDATDAPQWTAQDHRFLHSPWYWVDLPSVRRHALLGTPAAFRRRNVWIDRADLARI